MVEPAAKIRLYEPGDNKLVRFFIGKSHMEGLALANRKTYFHPLFLAVWFGLSCMLVQYFELWPIPGELWWMYLKPVPLFAASSLPLMFLVDWITRPAFEERAHAALSGPDFVDIQGYYSRSPSSGFWLLEYADNFIGLIAVDAAKPVDAKGPKGSKGTSDTAVIRHFYVQEEYRSALPQDDLLQYAVKQAFTKDPKVQKITATDTGLTPYISNALRKEGFVKEKTIGKLGVQGWSINSRVLTREDWERRLKEIPQN